MIQLPSNDSRRLALADDAQVPVALLALGFSPVMRITDSDYPVTVNGETFTPADGLVGITSPQATRELGRDLYECTFADSDPGAANSWARRFAQPTGISITVQVAFVRNGALTAPLDIYAGKCVGATRSAGGEGVLVTARFSGPFARLDDSASIVATDENQRTRDNTDTALRYVHETRDIVWGR